MSAVTQCDVCGNVVKNEESKYVKLFNCNSKGDTISALFGKDLCPECTAKLRKLLKEDEK